MSPDAKARFAATAARTAVGAKDRAVTGAVGGFGATFVLSGLREVLSRVGLVFETAPMQVVDRAE